MMSSCEYVTHDTDKPVRVAYIFHRLERELTVLCSRMSDDMLATARPSEVLDLEAWASPVFFHFQFYPSSFTVLKFDGFLI